MNTQRKESYRMFIKSPECFGVTNRILQLQQKNNLKKGTFIAKVEQAHLIKLEQSVDFLGGGS